MGGGDLRLSLLSTQKGYSLSLSLSQAQRALGREVLLLLLRAGGGVESEGEKPPSPRLLSRKRSCFTEHEEAIGIAKGRERREKRLRGQGGLSIRGENAAPGGASWRVAEPVVSFRPTALNRLEALASLGADLSLKRTQHRWGQNPKLSYPNSPF